MSSITYVQARCDIDVTPVGRESSEGGAVWEFWLLIQTQCLTARFP